MFNRLKGGTEQGRRSGLQGLVHHRRPQCAGVHPSSAKLSELRSVQYDDTDGAVPADAHPGHRAQAQGHPVEYAPPKEGPCAQRRRCVTANNDQPELAQQLAEYLLTPRPRPALELGDQIRPTPTPHHRQDPRPVEAMQNYLKTAVTIDWDEVNKCGRSGTPAGIGRWSASRSNKRKRTVGVDPGQLGFGATLHPWRLSITRRAAMANPPITVLREPQPPWPVVDACKWSARGRAPYRQSQCLHLSDDGSKIMGT